MEKVVTTELLSAIWTFLYLYSSVHHVNSIVQTILLIQVIISIIATIIKTYKEHGTKQRKSRKKTTY